MGDDVGTSISTIEAHGEGQLLQMGRLAPKREEEGSPKVNRFIAIIESRIFLQECIRRSMQSAFSLPILTCSTLSELELGLKAAPAAIVIVSWMEASTEVNTNILNALSELVPNVPGRRSCSEERRRPGANRHSSWREVGYIPCTLEFDITIEAVRFVLAGGTYVPMDCVFATGPSVAAAPVARPSGGVTTRESSRFIRALSNKASRNKSHRLPN